MKKIKMLVIPSDNHGCGRFRSIWPHKWMAENMSDIFDIDIMYSFPKDVNLEAFLSKYDIVHIHKQLDKNCQIANMIKFLGIKLIVDVDDNYFLSPQHPMYASARAEHWEKPIMEHLRLADMCSTTTSTFIPLKLKIILRCINQCIKLLMIRCININKFNIQCINQ